VAEQVAQGDRAAGGLGVVDRGGAGLEHAAPAQLGDVLLDRVVEVDPAFFPQYHHRAGRDELGVGEDAEQVVGRKRRARFPVGHADAVQVDQVAALQHRRGHAGEQVGVHRLLHCGVRGGEVEGAGVEGGC
jgi:hypothetical protein